ncbi:hypothetical protein [Rhodomicrobium lacus]|nr:hypothetical protein [Rhodomicrobium lacus]
MSSEARLYFDATLLTLVVLPALYAWLGKARRQRTGREMRAAGGEGP